MGNNEEMEQREERREIHGWALKKERKSATEIMWRPLYYNICNN